MYGPVQEVVAMFDGRDRTFKFEQLYKDNVMLKNERLQRQQLLATIYRLISNYHLSTPSYGWDERYTAKTD